MIVLFVVGWFAAELFVAIEVAKAIGVLLTILLLIASWPLGAWALRTQGRAAWRRLSAAVAAGRSPGREALDGALILVGGLLLIVPGFLSDLLAVCALLPPTRVLMRRQLVRHLHSRFVLAATRFADRSAAYDRSGSYDRPRPSNRSRPSDIESTATDVDQSQLHR